MAFKFVSVCNPWLPCPENFYLYMPYIIWVETKFPVVLIYNLIATLLDIFLLSMKTRYISYMKHNSIVFVQSQNLLLPFLEN